MKNGSTFTFGAALLALGALLFTPTHADAQERASARGWNWYHGTDTMKLDASEKTLLARYLNKKCLVQKMASPKRAFFADAVRHINSVLGDPKFVSMVKAKRDWFDSRDSGAKILSAAMRGETVNVFIYEREDGYPCSGTDVADGHTNAFTPRVGADMLFVYDPYLEKQMRERDHRELARTVIHEGMHALGYSHNAKVGTKQYNNSVPVYVGCLVERWGTSAVNNCGK